MQSSNLKKTLLASKIAVLLSGAVAMGAMAAEAETKTKTADADIETIEVTGIRASQQASLNTKRFSDAVVDAITAEDIGQFPDGDIGESLARIPGITVNRQFGQGQQVSIRGASNQLTNTLLNGHAVASTGWYDQQAIDRSFNYSLLPPEAIGSIEVYKSSQADLPEGGVGGTVIVNTRKPLDVQDKTAFFSAKGDYGTISETTDPELSGLYSWSNEDQTFGILGSASYAKTDYQRNGVESLLGWGEIVPTTFEQQRERQAYNVAMQYRPMDNLEFGLNILSLNLEADNANTSIFLFPTQQGDSTCNSVNAAGVCTSVEHSGKDAFAWAQTWARQASMSSDTYNFDFKYEGIGYTLDGLIGNSKADGGTDLTANYGNSIGKSSDFKGIYDATGDQIYIDIANKHFGAEDFNGQVGPEGWSLKRQPNSDEETYAQFNVTVPVDFGAINSIKSGVRYADHKVTQTTEKALVTAASLAGARGNASDYYNGTISSGAGFILPKPNYDAMINGAKSAITGFELDKSGYGTLNEKNLALYVMANFEAEGIRGNFGLRYISSDVESDYYDLNNKGEFANTLSTDKHDYSDVLPSINVAFDLAPDVILRASAAQVISRPNYADLFATSTLPGLNDGTPGNEVVNQGSVVLEPFKATQADLGIEWYFSADGLVAATYFIKDVSTFSSTRQLLNQQIGINDNDLIADGGSSCGVGVYDCWTVSERYNANGGKIDGIELQLQDSFDSGLGYAANYTYANAVSPAENYPDLVGVFSDSSKHTVNLVGFYEMEDFSVVFIILCHFSKIFKNRNDT
ncbi:TonB-dependent receptor [Shewanella sp. SNU WT4]|uniref:TonB-dependent receptor n=1 Tax=Shewanella sp. SNU WT4 TaxID=2590015 RepID=UPI0011296F12|nr:TonB-dependent receptor [Shewanella sp. SNU WT4]QDF66369.1 TonB-dependent receptor [Shewanella sp. SNU WT4]